MEDIYQAINLLSKSAGILKRHSTWLAVLGAHAKLDNLVLTHAGPQRLEKHLRETRAVLDGAPKLIGPVVGCR